MRGHVVKVKKERSVPGVRKRRECGSICCHLVHQVLVFEYLEPLREAELRRDVRIAANGDGEVPPVLQCLGQRTNIRRKHIPLFPFRCMPHGAVHRGVERCEEAPDRCLRGGRLAVGILKQDAPLRDAVDKRRGVAGIAITAEVILPKRIDEYNNDVRRRGP